MRPNKAKQALREGRNLVCVQPHFPSPELTEFLGHLGFDCIFIDAEHGGVGVECAQEMVRAADVTGASTLIRVPRNEASTILAYLETGVGGVLVPHVNTAEEACSAVRAVKFAPLGIRGAHSATRAAEYGAIPNGTAYFERANRESMVAVMIEEARAVENMDGILRTPGLDLCVVGREDLSMSLGRPGQPDHPEVKELVEVVLDRAREAGIAVGITTGDGLAVPALFQKGFQFVVVSASRLLAGRAREVLAHARGQAVG